MFRGKDIKTKFGGKFSQAGKLKKGRILCICVYVCVCSQYELTPRGSIKSWEEKYVL